MIDKLKLKLVEDWKSAWKWFSVQAMGVSIAVLGVWEVLPADLKALLPESATRSVAIFLLAAGVVGRVVDQKKVDN